MLHDTYYINRKYRRLGNPGCDKWMHNNGNRMVNTMDKLPKEVDARLTTSHRWWLRVCMSVGEDRITSA